MSAIHTNFPVALPPVAPERTVCVQRIRVALAALQSIAIDSASLSTDAIYMLKELAESEEELELDPDALARAIILRDSKRLEQLLLAA